MTKRIALWTAASLQNWGDRIIARQTEHQLRIRIPEAEFTSFCLWSDDRRIPRLMFDEHGRWPFESEFDAIVVVGGGVLTGPPFAAPFLQAFCFGPHPSAFAANSLVLWHAIGLSDDASMEVRPEWTHYLASVRERLDYCSVRSSDTARRIGPGSDGVTPTYIVPDGAYSLEPLAPPGALQRRPRIGVAAGSPFLTHQFMQRMGQPGFTSRCPFDPEICLTPKQRAAISVPFAEHTRQRTLLSRMVAALRRLGQRADIEFFGFGEMYGDAELAARLSASLPGSTCIVVGTGDDADVAQSLIASYDALVVSRFHAAILSHRSGRPFVAVDPHWNHRTQRSKLFELMTSIGRPQCYWRGEGGESATDQLTEMLRSCLEEGQWNHGVPFDVLHHDAIADLDRLAETIRNCRGCRTAVSG